MSKPDPVAEKSGFLRMYMSGHPDTLVAYAKWFGKVEEVISSAEMTAIDTKSMMLTCTLKNGNKKEVYIPIEPPLRGYEDVKPRLLEMKAFAQEGLGMIKAPHITAFEVTRDIRISAAVMLTTAYLAYSPVNSPSPLFQPANLVQQFVGAGILRNLGSHRDLHPSFGTIPTHFGQPIFPLQDSSQALWGGAMDNAGLQDDKEPSTPTVSIIRAIRAYTVRANWNINHSIMQSFRDPFIAEFVQKLRVQAWFIKQLDLRKALLQKLDKSLTRSISDHLQGALSFFDPQARVASTIKGNDPTKYTAGQILALMGEALSHMNNLTCYSFEWRDLPLNDNSRAFLKTIQQSANCLRKLVLHAQIRNFKHLLSYVDFDNLEDISLHFNYDVLGRSKTSEDIVKTNCGILEMKIAPFINRLAPSLNRLSISVYSNTPMIALFNALEHLPYLRNIELNMPFGPKSTPPSIILQFLSNHSSKLHHVKINPPFQRTAHNGGKSPPESDREAIESRKDSWSAVSDLLLKSPSILSNLKTLEVPCTGSLETTLDIVRRSSSTLTSLSLSGKYLTPVEQVAVYNLFTSRPLYDRLRHLRIDVTAFDLKVIYDIASQFPKLESLLLVIEVEPKDLNPLSYQQTFSQETIVPDLTPHMKQALQEWTLQDLDIWVERYQEHQKDRTLYARTEFLAMMKVKHNLLDGRDARYPQIPVEPYPTSLDLFTNSRKLMHDHSRLQTLLLFNNPLQILLGSYNRIRHAIQPRTFVETLVVEGTRKTILLERSDIIVGNGGFEFFLTTTQVQGAYLRFASRISHSHTSTPDHPCLFCAKNFLMSFEKTVDSAEQDRHEVAVERKNGRKSYFGMTGTQLNIWVTVACTTAMTLFGYDQGVFGGIIVTEDFLNTMGNPDPNLQGTIVSLYDIGCFFGAISTFIFGERYGRKKTFIVGVIIMSIGAVLQTCAFSVAQMIVARLITGFGNGINTATAPVWQSETSKPSWRGKLVVFEMIMNIAGFSLSNWMTYGFSFIEGSLSWRFPIAFQLVFSIILISTIPWLPESPRWLLAHGFEEKGVDVLVALEGPQATSKDAYIITQRDEILEAVRIERETAPSWRDIMKGNTGDTGMITRLVLGSGTQWMQQLVGINVTSYYLPLVLQNSVGLSNNLARLLAACNSVSYLVFSFFGLILIETAGRRKLMMWGAAGQCVCYIFITALLSKSGDPSIGARYGAGATAFFFLYYVFFGICWQGVPWLYPTEINSLSMRTKGAALGTASNWISNYIVVQITPTGIANLGWRFYIIWVVFNAVFVPLIWLVYPETANRHLEDIDKLYRENKNMIFVFRNKEAIQVERPQRFIDADQERLNLSRRGASRRSQDDPEE
ncbi:hypothetical protein NP233_g4231 [Leucocoprinus birnbaumii]|uniref:Major facilitator superfamily (MFS) profile domain-containing protein n=1 Tax=Leucocoprinus birnbaumii TaxID=56174 RepID=A0AAD5VWH2_9AGAR|nr:hypothetical protein NP233_g4231 [Leucocoprinus birnbaumii]